jgi:hypothetical protein
MEKTILLVVKESAIRDLDSTKLWAKTFKNNRLKTRDLCEKALLRIIKVEARSSFASAKIKAQKIKDPILRVYSLMILAKQVFQRLI